MFQVRGLEFNVIAPNLLASGAEDGEICIWDLTNTSEPNLFPSLKVRDYSLESVHVTYICPCSDGLNGCNLQIFVFLI